MFNSKSKVKIIALAIAAFFILGVAGVAITQTGSSKSASASAASNIGVVNFQVLFEQHPDTAKAQQTMQAESEQARKDFEAKIATMNNDKEKQEYANQLQQRLMLKEQELRHAREVDALHAEQQAAADKAILSFSQEQARRTLAERPQEPDGFEKLWRTIKEAVDDEARRQRLVLEAQQARDAADRRNDEIRIMVSGLQAAQRQEIDALVDRQGKERADLLDEQARDLKRRTEDEQRAIALEREYEQRRRDALAKDREGPERDPRAR